MASVEDLPYHHSYICVKTEMKVHETIRPSMSARPCSFRKMLAVVFPAGFHQSATSLRTFKSPLTAKAWSFFKLLDADAGGSVEIEELLILGSEHASYGSHGTAG